MNHHESPRSMLCLFGRPLLTAPSGDRVDLSPSGWRLLAAVAAAPDEGIARAALAEIVSPSGKLGTLRKLVFEVRRTLDGAGLSPIEGEGDVLRLSDDLYCDLRDLRAPRPRRAPHEIYRGTFFDARFAFEHGPWTAWLAERRDEFRRLYLARATETLLSLSADRAEKVREAFHLLKMAPDSEDAAQVLMLDAARTSDAEGRRHGFGALRVGREDAGGRPDRSPDDAARRLVGASRREPGIPPAAGMDLPTIFVATPPSAGRGRGARMLRSLLVDVTIGLCRASMFRVVASEHAGSPVGTPAGAPARSYLVAAKIVDHVLGPQIVFTLMSHPDREILWADKVEAVADSSVAAYNLLTAGVLRSLVARIKDLEIEAFRLDAAPGAYALYLAGYTSLATLDLAQLRKGRHHLRRSMSQSPGFAPTTSALARSYQLEWLVTGRGEQDLLTRARAHSLQAISSDPHEARGFKALGFCDLFEKNYDTALKNYTKAEQLNQNYAELIAEHANCLLHCGMLEEAIVKIDYAMRLNPEFGDMDRWTKASACFLLERYDDVLAIVGEMRDREPAYRLLAATHALIGNRDEATICRMKAMEAYPTMTIAGWTSIVALKDPRHIRHYAEGLAKAGFR